LIGHLFDTNGFNQVLNACEEMDVQFRIIEWEIGLNIHQHTQVTVQVMSVNDTALDEAKAKVEEICKQFEIKIVPATGPAYDEPVKKQVHAGLGN